VRKYLQLDISILGAHSNESNTSKCISILIDGVLAIDAGGLTSSLSLREQKKIKSILLTHEHFDHIKDIPLLALNLFRMKRTVNIYSLPSIYSTIKKHLLNGQVYPELHGLPAEKPTVNFRRIVPLQERKIEEYQVMAVPVKHHLHSVGYQVCNGAGKSIFYTGDTGPGLSDCWQNLKCDLLFIETTLPNSYHEYARQTGHLTPKFLLAELKLLQKIKGKLPQIVVIHNDPLLEDKIKEEISVINSSLNTKIAIASEGMRFTL
jgi:ribonuclease BN (tRNA processing enzyme)